MAAEYLAQDSFWLNRRQVEDAEYKYQEYLANQQFGSSSTTSSLASEIEKARNQIKQSLHLEGGAAATDSSVVQRIVTLEKENQELRKVTSDLQAAVKKLEQRIQSLETGGSKPAQGAKPAPAKPAANESSDDDDFDLFGSDSEDDEENEKMKAERVKAYQERKAKKPVVIAKSNIILDVKPWDDETDMAELEKCVKSIKMDGLVWGASKLVPVGFGIKKLQISCVVEDDKVSTDDLDEKITGFEDFVQSMDIVAFNKV